MTDHHEKVIVDHAAIPVAKVVPVGSSVKRTTTGSLAGRLDLSGDWDAPRTNAEIADDFA